MSDTDDLDAVRRISEILRPFDSLQRRRIARWAFERLGETSANNEHALSEIEAIDVSENLLLNPHQALATALANNDLEKLRSLLKRFREIGAEDSMMVAAVSLAGAGERDARDLVADSVRRGTLRGDVLKAAVSSLVQYYIVKDQEVQGLSELRPLVLQLAEGAENEIDRAYFYNQFGRLLYGAGLYSEALDYQTMAHELDASEPAYAHNLSLIHEKLGRIPAAANLAKAAVAGDRSDVIHLAHAVQVLNQAGFVSDAKEAFSRLKKADPARAQALLNRDDELRRRMAPKKS